MTVTWPAIGTIVGLGALGFGILSMWAEMMADGPTSDNGGFLIAGVGVIVLIASIIGFCL